MVCYDMLDQLQQYKKYLDSMKLIRVPLHNPQPAAVATAGPSATDVPSTQSVTTAQGTFLESPLTTISSRFHERNNEDMRISQEIPSFCAHVVSNVDAYGIIFYLLVL